MSDSTATVAVKIPVMIFMFLEIVFFGSLPLRLKAFKENKLVLSLSAAFSGGLFLAIGLLHLLPEANESFDNYYEQQAHPQDEKNQTQGEGEDEEDEHFPWPFLISTLSFALILFIEKILTAGWGGEYHHHLHHHHHGEADDHENADAKHSQSQNNSDQGGTAKMQINPDDQISQISSNKDLKKSLLENDAHRSEDITDQENCEIAQEEDVRNIVSSTSKIVQRISMNQGKDNLQSDETHINKLTPYILQIAIGIHAIFEGMAIGLQQQWLACLAISLAVVFHKWAEGLTLGIAYRKAEIDLKVSTINILIQATMNPLGIGIGWALSNQGDLVSGIFVSISVGTFIYIATMEVLVEEFNLSRYRYLKFGLFMVAIGFVCTLWFLEQLSDQVANQ